jgi:hypothetical protein
MHQRLEKKLAVGTSAAEAAVETALNAALKRCSTQNPRPKSYNQNPTTKI